MIKTASVSLLLLPVFSPEARAADYDYRKVLSEVGARSAASDADKRLWRSQLDAASAVTIEETRDMFRAAAQEFNVPQILLEAIGYLENNWIQVGPSIDGGWGIMHLVENDHCRTLMEAASLLGLDPQTLKDDPRQNIRGAAALLAAYAAETASAPGPVRVPAAPSGPLVERLLTLLPGAAPAAEAPEPVPGAAGVLEAGPSLEDWFPAVSRFSGLRTRELRDFQARNYFRVIARGVEERNVFNRTVRIEPAGVDLAAIGALSASSFLPRSQDYPPALSNISPNNFTYGRGGQRVDTIVEHWMGVGTYAGAISWFHDPRANASAHFCIRHDDGEVTQVVRVNDTAWHSGCQSCPWTNNARSIGVEHEATVTHPEWWDSEPMLDASAALSAFFAGKYGIPLSHPEGMGATGGIIGHNQVPGCDPGSGCHTDCPGNLPWDVLMKKISDIGSDEV